TPPPDPSRNSPPSRVAARPPPPFDIPRDALARPAAAELENPIHQRAAALPGGHDAVEIRPQTTGLRGVAQGPLTVAENCPEYVVEVVGDAPRQRAHSLEALRLT